MFRIYLANKIGTVSLGVYQIGFSVFIVFVSVLTSGLPLVVSKLTAKYRIEKNLVHEQKIVTASLIIGLMISTVLFFALVLLKPVLTLLLSSENAYYVLLSLAPSLFAVAIFSAFKGSLWGQQKHFALSLIDLIEEIAKMAFTVLLIELTLFSFSGEISASVSVTISCFISMLLTMRYYFKINGGLKKPQKQDYHLLLKTAMPITGLRIASSLLQPFIAIIIPLRLVASGFTKEQALSQLGIALGMTFPLLFLPLTIVGALSVTIIPSLSSLIEKKNKPELLHQINSGLLFSIFVSFLFIPAYIGLGVPIGEFLFSNTQSGVYLMQAAYIMVPLSLSNITASILNAINLEIKSFKNYILGSILLVLSLWFLPKYIGVRALLYGMALCMASVTVLNMRMLEKSTQHKFKIGKTLLFMSLFLLPSSLLCTFTHTVFLLFFPRFLAILLSAGLGTVMFVLLCIIFNFIQVDFWMLKFKNLVNVKKQKSSIA